LGFEISNLFRSRQSVIYAIGKFFHHPSPPHFPDTAMQRALIIIGLAVVAAGLLWPWISKLGLGRLPGDIRMESESGGFYFPIVTCLVISIILSLLLWIFRR
jgi:DUF2905 family protein